MISAAPLGLTVSDLPLLLAGYAADSLFWAPSRFPAASAWYGHVPFAHWLVSAIRPRLVVELGTHNGVSFAAFCEAVRRHALPSRCIAVDLWQGDMHAGFYSDTVYRDLSAFVGRLYREFAELRRKTFSDALADVPDGSIDLLHVDGRHRYDDVREDFESWKRKLSPRAVVLFHDVSETREDFGVWQYWQELTRQAPHFTFTHAHGLGVLLPGDDPPDAAIQLCAIRNTEIADTVRERFEAFGQHWITELLFFEAKTSISALRNHIEQLQAHIGALGDYTAKLERELPHVVR